MRNAVPAATPAATPAAVRARTLAAATVAALATAPALAGPRTIQLTASDADSSVERVPVALRTRWVAIRSSADLTPGAPGNADRSAEIFRGDLFTGALAQVTDSDGGVSAPRVSYAGNVFVASREDLTPGAPGNADGSFESWFFGAADLSFRQLTATAEDTFFLTLWDDGDRAFFGSRGDLTPGAPGNADASYEVYSYDFAEGAMRQVTASASNSILRGVCSRRASGIVESNADLAPVAGDGGNADGSREVFLFGFRGEGFRQITSSGGDSSFAGVDDDGRFVAVESRADLVPGGNPSGALAVYVWDLARNVLTQATPGTGDCEFASFVPHSNLVAVHSRADLVGRNADGSQEVFVADVRGRALRQQTESGGDTTLLGVGGPARRWAVYRSSGQISPDAGSVGGTRDLYAQRIAAGPTRIVRLTNGDDDVGFAGFTVGGRIAIDTTADLAPARPGNADGSREVYLVRLGAASSRPSGLILFGSGGRVRVEQVTATGADSRVVAASPKLPLLAIESRGDLVAGGNADGSLEVYAHRFGRLPARLPTRDR